MVQYDEEKKKLNIYRVFLEEGGCRADETSSKAGGQSFTQSS